MSRFKAGDAVYGRPRDGRIGTFAEFIAVNAADLARKHKVDYAFHFMHASGEQLERLTPLFEDATLRPVVDRVFPFNQARQALAYVESGHAKGKVVLQMI